jgi:DNA-binding response OmpR family regulator
MEDLNRDAKRTRVISARSHSRSTARPLRLHNDEVFDRSNGQRISRLHHKIESDPRRPRRIRTERSPGYVFAVSVQTIY